MVCLFVLPTFLVKLGGTNPTIPLTYYVHPSVRLLAVCPSHFCNFCNFFMETFFYNSSYYYTFPTPHIYVLMDRFIGYATPKKRKQKNIFKTKEKSFFNPLSVLTTPPRPPLLCSHVFFRCESDREGLSRSVFV